MPTFVLLHDAFQGGWIWNPIARELRSLGCTVYSPTFTGSGERSHIEIPESPAQTYLEDVENLFRYEAITDAVLVCNGFSGMLGPMLAARLQSRIRALVFLDAALPAPGRSYADLAPQPVLHLLQENTRAGAVRPFASGLAKLHTQGDNVAYRLTPFPARAFNEPYPGPGFEEWPESTFLHCTGDHDTFAKPMYRRAGAMGMKIVEIDLLGLPVMARHHEIAREIKTLAPQPGPRTRSACGSTPMPEEMRLLYCPRHRMRRKAALHTEPGRHGERP